MEKIKIYRPNGLCMSNETCVSYNLHEIESFPVTTSMVIT